MFRVLCFKFYEATSGSEERILAEGEHLDGSVRRNSLERGAKEGKSPVLENSFALLVILLEYLDERILRGNPAELSAKTKYFW